MAVTRSKAADRADVIRIPGQRPNWRGFEFAGALFALIAVAVALTFVYRVKSQALAEVERGLAAKELLNLNELGAREDLLPALAFIPDLKERQETARKIYYVTGGLRNVGGIRPVLTGEQFCLLKPRFVVRRPEAFRRTFFLWAGLFLASFLFVHLWWRVRRFRGDESFLPAILLLSGEIGRAHV